MNKVAKLVSSIIICQLVALVGAAVTFPAITSWYVTLNKPGFTPPNWLFGPVWTILFLLMGISLYLVWEKGTRIRNVRKALYYFSAQLGLNFLWSLFFFGWHNPLLAFFDIIVLWLAILFTISQFEKISKLAAYLLYPYLFWVSLATILNFAIVILNK